MLHLDDTQRRQYMTWKSTLFSTDMHFHSGSSKTSACKSKIALQWHLLLRNRHVRESQQEYTVAALLSRSSSIRASISLNAVAPFVQHPFGSERRENPVQTTQVDKRTKQLVAQVAGHRYREQICVMADLWTKQKLHVSWHPGRFCCICVWPAKSRYLWYWSMINNS